MQTEWIDGRALTVNELCHRYDLPREEIQSFQDLVRIYPIGTAIITEGEVDRTLFVLRKGRVAVYKQVNPNERERISTIEAINMFGEMSLLNGDARSATVVAESLDVVVYAVGRPNIQIILSNQRWAEMLITRLSKNLAQANDQIASTSHSLIEARAEIEKLEDDLRQAHGERALVIESLSRLCAVLVGFQSMIQDEAVVGSRGWAYLHALNEVTRLLIKKYIPELTGQVQPLDKRALRAALLELGKYGQNQVYKSLLESLQHEDIDQ